MVAFGKLTSAAAAFFVMEAMATSNETVVDTSAATTAVTEAVGGCKDITEKAMNPECFTNVEWAMDTGMKTMPEFYVNYTNPAVGAPLTVNSSMMDFQCALAGMVGKQESGTGYDCPMPCTSTLAACPQKDLPPVIDTSPTVVDTNAELTTDKEITDSVASEGTPKEEGSGFPWWAWCLVMGPLLCCIGGLLYYFLVMKAAKGAKKSKRSVKKPTKAAAPAPAPALAPAPVETALIAPPVYTSAAPVYAAPQVRSMSMQMAPVAAPVQTTAMPIQTYAAAPVQTYAAAPVAQYAAPLQYASTYATTFDALDSNHDGVISRQEFANMMR